MIQTQTYLNVSDNSGAKKIMCISIISTKRKYAKIGDTIIAVVKKASPNKIIKKSMIVKALIIRTTKPLYRKHNNMYISFNENAAIIINTDNTLKGTNIFGPVPRELMNIGFTNLNSTAKLII
uniref:Large ribosomal subunit protein uL14c n=1 Tax=Euglena longa TaxID=3037 RepID=RK14_EUGLO|nr:ribosomal protein L14 [Euglena longa]P58139.1 RecName: Full=Large ribosomal subunit protein uL14c; AltName: Full=50S ribosomal protein L14, plastid [Euglena longa]CAC24601.1 ribosomal protein L14 [Euglena longa]